MARLHLLRVFCDQAGAGGNALAVFLDGAQVPDGSRQAVAAELGLSETVFVDDAERGELRIFTPTVELPWAGHPTVGTAWLLAAERGPVATLHVPAGELRVRYADGDAFVAARPEWGPSFRWERLPAPADLEALDGPPGGQDQLGVWAWIDEAAGTVRARVFAGRYGIAEDEATGSAAAILCAQLARPVEIHQGRGSLIAARPLADGFVEVGGASVLDDVRDFTPPPAQGS